MIACALCLEEKPLRKSHILPEFLYTPLYDGTHRYFLLTDGERIGRIPRKKGLYEELLCYDCEQLLSTEYEDYAAKLLFTDQIRGVETQMFDNMMVIKGIEYPRFKLFQTSLLWRCSITNRREFYPLDLGPHQEKMRLMLLNRDPGASYRYGCILFYLPNMPEELLEVIVPPELLAQRMNGHRFYRAVFNGIFWIYCISSHTQMFRYRDLFLSEEGILQIINSKDRGWSFMTQLANQFSDVNRI